MQPNDQQPASSTPRPIQQIAEKLGIDPEDLSLYGQNIAKIDLKALQRPARNQGQLILVSATTPTVSGEGKTTTTIGLGQALARLGKSVCIALRQPSLGPCLGIKGGATGGGASQVVPADRINLHFTGDMHAVSCANNLLAATLDNHIFQGNSLAIDPRRILWRRAIDMNDRSLRHIVLGLGGNKQGVPREGGFDISAASEVMAMLCLASDIDDLRRRLERTLVAFTYAGEPIYAKDLRITEAMLVLLRDALQPNLVQTTEGVPALIHGGPFANIAHGCSSLLATRLACHSTDWAITEAGFGFDLGAEKFFDIKCRLGHLDPQVVVLVTTVRALKRHGGATADELAREDLQALSNGLANLEKHIENVQKFGKQPVVAINRFSSDRHTELDIILEYCKTLKISAAVCDHFHRGGEGALDLAAKVIDAARDSRSWRPLYQLDLPVEEKIRIISREMYGADDVAFTKQAERDLEEIRRLHYADLPVCIAKAPGSLSDNPMLYGRPRHFDITVHSLQVNSGAGFLVALTGDILRMPGLPRHPAAEHWRLLEDGSIAGLG